MAEAEEYMTGTMLACLLIILGLLLADRLRMRFVARREREHRAHLRARERRLQERWWEGQIPVPEPVRPEPPQPER